MNRPSRSGPVSVMSSRSMWLLMQAGYMLS